jgi:glycerol uptake facilitator-like aquaporin
MPTLVASGLSGRELQRMEAELQGACNTPACGAKQQQRDDHASAAGAAKKRGKGRVGFLAELSPFTRALLAEGCGTGFIVLFGCGSVLASFSGAYAGVGQVALVWGVGVALAIFTTAPLSGAHLNPAVTLSFLLVRPKAQSMTPAKAAAYACAQLAGAVAAGALNLLLYGGTIEAFERAKGIERGEPSSVLSASGFGEYFPNPSLCLDFGGPGPYRSGDVSVGHALLTEAWGTAVLCFVIFALTHPKNHAAAAGDKHRSNMSVAATKRRWRSGGDDGGEEGGSDCDCGPEAGSDCEEVVVPGGVVGVVDEAHFRPSVPLLIGGAVFVLLMLYAPITQAGWNPARDFGPRLVAYWGGWGTVAIPGPRSGFWVYIAGPLLGGPVGAFLAEKVLWG